jgi:hypothetical protein
MRFLTRVAAIGAFATAAVLAMSSSALAVSSGCSDTWTNTSGGAWDTGSNWSTGTAPGSGDNVCITAAGTYTVVIGNETITVASLTMGGSGSSPTLQIGNGGSGFPHISVTGAITNAATIDYGFGGTFSAGSMTNSGTFEVPSTGFGAAITFGNVSNTGTFSVAGGATLSQTSGTTFDNDGGTISNAASSTLAVSSSSSPAGTIELDSGGVVNNSGTITDAGTLLVDGGSICGNAVTLGSGDGGTGGALQFPASAGTGPACGSGVATDQIFIANVAATLSGTIPSAYTVSVGDGGSSFFALTLSANVVNDGTFAPGWGGTVSAAAATDSLTNNGTLIVPASGFNTSLDTTVINNGAADFNAQTTTISLGTGTSWSNASAGMITIASGDTVNVSSPSGDSATFTQDGLLNNSGTLNIADPVVINGGSICGNALNLGSGDGGTGATLSFGSKLTKGPACAKGVASDHLFIYNVTATIATNIPSGYTIAIGDGGPSYAHVGTPGNLTNAGILEPGWGATLTVTGTLTNTGTITVPKSGFTTVLDVNSLVDNGTVTADAAVDVNLASGGTFTVGAKHALTAAKGDVDVAGPVVNDGTVTIDGKAELNVNDLSSTPSNYTQASTATLVDPVGTKTGTLNVTGTATLAGAVNLSSTTFTPSYGGIYPIITDGAVSGTFSSITGPYILTYGTTVDAVGRPTATIKLSPTSGTAPASVKVTGVGYEKAEFVNIYLNSTSSTPLGTATATKTGAISETVTIPAGTSNGPHSVITVGQSSGQTATTTFTVT